MLTLGRFSDGYAREFEKQIQREKESSYKRVTQFGFTDLAPFARNGVECLVTDSFTQCFEVSWALSQHVISHTVHQSKHENRWVSKFYLVPLYLLGVIFRYLCARWTVACWH